MFRSRTASGEERWAAAPIRCADAMITWVRAAQPAVRIQAAAVEDFGEHRILQRLAGALAEVGVMAWAAPPTGTTGACLLPVQAEAEATAVDLAGPQLDQHTQLTVKLDRRFQPAQRRAGPRARP